MSHHDVVRYGDGLTRTSTAPVLQSRWRARLKRGFKIALALLSAILVVGWWHVLRIVEHDNWPIPDDATTAEQSQEMAEQFISRNGVQRDDVAIPYTPSIASQADLFLNGLDFFPVMLTDLRNADHSIHILMYAFAPEEWGDQFADVLLERKSAGVEVRVIVEGQGSKPDGQNSAMYERLANGGVQIVINDTFPLQARGELPDRQKNPAAE